MSNDWAMLPSFRRKATRVTFDVAGRARDGNGAIGHRRNAPGEMFCIRGVGPDGDTAAAGTRAVKNLSETLQATTYSDPFHTTPASSPKMLSREISSASMRCRPAPNLIAFRPIGPQTEMTHRSFTRQQEPVSIGSQGESSAERVFEFVVGDFHWCREHARRSSAAFLPGPCLRDDPVMRTVPGDGGPQSRQGHGGTDEDVPSHRDGSVSGPSP